MRRRRPSQNQKLDRRHFLGTDAAAGAVGYFVNPGSVAASTSPNEQLNLACVGATNRAAANIAALKSQNFVAIVDIDSNLLEKGCVPYPGAYGKGMPCAGRTGGKQPIENSNGDADPCTRQLPPRR